MDDVQVAKPVTEPRAETSAVILEAAVRILASGGFQKLTARGVAEEAGTNLALLNYYFGDKKGLLLAIYDQLEHKRFVRQAALYTDTDEPLSAKWRQAVAYYRRDLDDGFVRVHHELLAQGFADEKLAERARQRIVNWSAMLTKVAERYLPAMGVEFPASQLVPAFAAFWYGMEQQHLIGVPESASPYFEMLDAVGDWLEEREKLAGIAQDGDRDERAVLAPSEG